MAAPSRPIATALLLAAAVALIAASLVAGAVDAPMIRTRKASSGGAHKHAATGAPVKLKSGGVTPPPYCGLKQAPIPPTTTADGVANLVQVQVLIRHGDRTRFSADPCWAGDDQVWECGLTQLQHVHLDMSDESTALPRVFRKQYIPNREVIPGNCGLGQLTNFGYAQQMINGQNLRDAYGSFFPHSYWDDAENFYLRSDDAARTLASGQGLFVGMYPTYSNSSSDNARIIDWWVMDEDVETMVPADGRCPAIDTVRTNSKQSPDYTKHIDTVTVPLAKQLSQVLGVPVEPENFATNGMATKWDCLMTSVCHGLPIPEGVDQELFDAVYAESTWQVEYTLNQTGYAPLVLGQFIGELAQNMQDIVSGADGAKKFFLFSGHDDGPIMPFLAALNINDGIWVPYATMITLELYSLTAGGYGVRIVYNGQVMTVPGCGGPICPLDTFVSIAQKLVPSAAQCAGTAPPPS